MNILIFNWKDIKNPAAGGAEVYTHENAKRWVKGGNKVTLFTSEFFKSKKEEIIEGVRVVRAGKKYSVYLKAREYYKKYFSKENFDIVIDEINTLPFFTYQFVKNDEKIIVLIHQLAREFWDYEIPFPANILGRYFLEDMWLKKYKNTPTITVSDSTKDDLKSLGFEKIFIVHNGLNLKPLDKVPERNRKPTVIYVGRMKKAKRPQDALEAFRCIKEKVSDARLWMIGSGYMKEELEKRTFKDVKFFGYVSNEVKFKLMKKAWLTLIPSVREGWCQTVTDSNALGLPSIAYNVPGLKDSVKNGKTGILVKNTNNPKSLAKVSIKVLEDEKLRRKLSENALEWSRRFDWDKSSEKFMGIMKEVVSSSPSSKNIRNVLSIDLESWVHMENIQNNRKDLDDSYIIYSARKILKLLERYDVETTFFVVGEIYDWYPTLIEEIEEAGHEIAFHSYSHRVIRDKKILSEELEKSKKFLQEFKPRGFRAPLMYLEKNCLSILSKKGFKYDSSTYSSFCTFEKNSKISEVPVSSFEFFKIKTNLSYPKNLLSSVKRGEIPIGSGYFFHFFGKKTSFFIEKLNKRKEPAILFTHPWQIVYERKKRNLIESLLNFSNSFPHCILKHINDSYKNTEYLLSKYKFCSVRELLENM